VEGSELSKKAEENYLRISYVPAPRGLIYSKEGILLVENIASQEKSQEPGMEKQKIENFYRKYIGPSEAKNLYFSLITGYMREVSPEEKEKDSYYSFGDWIGKSGLEKEYEKYLRGTKGQREKIVNAEGEILSDKVKEEPQKGGDLILNIDAGLQKKIYDTIFKKVPDKNSAAIALNPQNGNILALVSLPSDDNNIFSKKLSEEGISKLEEEKKIYNLNRAIAGLYPSGSTIKPIIGAAALEENIVTPQTRIDCKGRIIIPNRWDPQKPYVKLDWKAHGITDLEKAIAESCNVYFYTVGGGDREIEGLGIDRIKKYLDLFYIEDKLGIDLPGEEIGFVPTPGWFKSEREKTEKRPWSISDVYDVSIGQGYFLTTPLHLALSLSAIANGGKIYQPQIVDKIVGSNKEVIKDIKPKILNEGFIKKENIEAIREGMRACVLSRSGSCRQLLSLPVTSAGKTGTAQTEGTKEPHAWFVSFAPYENPEILLLIMVEYGGSGEKVTEPIAKEVLDWYFSR
jgi:penicillin-binding protein 2